MRLEAYGIVADLPRRWEGAITRGAAPGPVAPLTAGAAEAAVLDAAAGDGGETVFPVAHFATIPLPPNRGDFGSGAVDELGPGDVLVALLEYGPECVGTPAFGRQGMPRRATRLRFGTRALQRAIPGQAGWQVFFTEGNRAFCLFVVLGRDHDVDPLLAEVNAILAGIQIEARP